MDRLLDRRRLEAVRLAAGLDETVRVACDRIARVAAAVLDADIALVTLIEADRQILLGLTGLPEPIATTRETPLTSLCLAILESAEPLVIEDTRVDPRARDAELVKHLGVGAYCGAPIITSDDHILGTVCATTARSRVWTDREVAMLVDLAAITRTEIDLREEVASRRAAETALRQSAMDASRSRDQLATLMDTMSDGFVALDRELRYVYVNPSAANMLGKSREQLLGQHIWSVFPEGIGQPFYHAYYRALETQQPERLEEHYEPWGRWFENRIYPTPELLSIFFTEITARKEAEQSLRTLNEELEQRITERTRQLEEATANKSELLARVSHELRAPLHGILGFAQLLRDGSSGPVTEAQREHLRDILDSGAHLLAVIDELLDVARAEAGRVRVSPQEIELPHLFRLLEADAAGLVAGGRQRIACKVDPGLEAVVTDPKLVRQITVNFVSNAVKYGRAEATIVIGARRVGAKRWRLEVSDDGPGLSREEIQRLLASRYPMDGRTGAGTGLGLIVTHRFVAAMRGSLGAEPNDAGGTTFYAELPRMVEPTD